MIRIYCDWNDGLDEKRFALSCAGSLEDIQKHAEALKEGLRVLFYQPDELEAEGALAFDQEMKAWIAIPDFSTKRYIGLSAQHEKRG